MNLLGFLEFFLANCMTCFLMESVILFGTIEPFITVKIFLVSVQNHD